MGERLHPLLTCEHGGGRVPAGYARLFRGREALLRSHRGLDFGALSLAQALAAALGAPLFAVTVTRLLVDANRSPGRRSLFSEVTRGLPPPERDYLRVRYHSPHWERVKRAVEERVADGGRVLHLGVHSFTPVLDGKVRRGDVGLLYDPARPAEARLAHRWQALLRGAAPELRVRRNDPYRGTADGLVTALRRNFPPSSYLGLELEVNQAFPLGPRARWTRLRRLLAETLASALAPAEPPGNAESHRRRPHPRRGRRPSP